MSTYITELIQLIMTAIPGMANTRIYRMAAHMVAFVEEDVLGNAAHHLVNQYRMLEGEYVTPINQVDYSGHFRKQAFISMLKWAKEHGFADNDGNFLRDEDGIRFLSQDQFNYRVENERLRLLSNHFRVQELFQYMPGIGFVIKADRTTKVNKRVLVGHRIWDLYQKAVGQKVVDCVRQVRGTNFPIYKNVEVDEVQSWQEVCYKLRAIKVALQFLAIDPETHPTEVALFNATSDKLPVLTETDMELACFDREDMNFNARMGRAQNQEGHQFSRIRIEAAGYDGWAGLQAAHDKIPEFRDEVAHCSRYGHKGHVGNIVAFSSDLNRIGFYMQDVNQTALLTERHYMVKLDKKGNPVLDDNGHEIPILDQYGNQKKNFAYWVNKDKVTLMGRQMSWIDKTGDRPRKPGKDVWTTLHSQHVIDPTALKLYANRAVMDPSLPLPTRVERLTDHTYERCILDTRKSDQCANDNPFVYAVSQRQQNRSGDYRYVILWKPGWKTIGVFQVYQLTDWRFCVNSFSAYNRDARFIGLEIGESKTEYGLKSEILNLMGIKVTYDDMGNQVPRMDRTEARRTQYTS